MDTSVIEEHEKHGRRYSDETRELAFQLWEMRCQKNARKVSALLATEEFGALDISERTVRRWAEDDAWESEAMRRFDLVFPGIHHYLFRSVVYAAVEGVPYWQDVNAGRVDEPNKNRLQAITAAFDRVGFSPIGKGVQPVKGNPLDNPLRLAGLSDDELHERESTIGAGRQG